MSFFNEGYEIVNDFITPGYVDAIKSETEKIDIGVQRGGVRNAEKKFKTVRELLAADILSNQAGSYLKQQAYFVRAILFDKTPTNNWLVTWHQDKTIAVSAKQEINGWGPWSIKDGRHHVQPRVEVLNAMVTFRIHIDESTGHNGCLRLIPSSSNIGLMSPSQISRCVEAADSVQCIAKTGSALIMRPHIVHASSKAVKPSRRRVLHVEYSSYALPKGLEWA